MQSSCTRLPTHTKHDEPYSNNSKQHLHVGVVNGLDFVLERSQLLGEVLQSLLALRLLRLPVGELLIDLGYLTASQKHMMVITMDMAV